MRVQAPVDCPGDGFSESRRNGVRHLLLARANCAQKAVGVGEALESCSFSNGQPPMLAWVNQHVLSEIADHLGGRSQQSR